MKQEKNAIIPRKGVKIGELLARATYKPRKGWIDVIMTLSYATHLDQGYVLSIEAGSCVSHPLHGRPQRCHVGEDHSCPVGATRCLGLFGRRRRARGRRRRGRSFSSISEGSDTATWVFRISQEVEGHLLGPECSLGLGHATQHESILRSSRKRI